MEVEDVARIRFAAWRTTEQERDLAVAGGVLGEIVVDDQSVLAVVAEVLSHGGGGEGSKVLHRGGLGGRGGDDDGVGHGAVALQGLYDTGYGGALLTDGAVDADEVVFRRVDDGIESDGGLARLTIADEQLALTAADGDHRVDGLDAGRHGLSHGLAVDDAGSDALDGQGFGGVDGTLVIDGLAEGVDHAADERVADGYGHDLAGTLDLIAFAQLGVVAEQYGTDLILVEVHGQTGDAVGEVDQFARHDLVQPMDAGDAVAQRDDGADLIHVDAVFVAFNLLAQQLGNLVCPNAWHGSLLLPALKSSSVQRPR